MLVKDLVLWSLGESWEYLTRAVGGLIEDELAYIPDPENNSIGFIYWHVIRAEDVWVSRFFLKETEVYESGGWREKLGTPAEDFGVDYTAEQVRNWPVPELDVLNGYADAVRQKTIDFVQNLTSEKLAEEIDIIGKPVPIGVYQAHLVTEIAMHVGQISYLRGVIRGMEPTLWP